MPSSRSKKPVKTGDFFQMPLDFVQENQYINAPLEGVPTMSTDIFEALDRKISELLARYGALKEENMALAEENARFRQEREGLKARVDEILSRIEGV